MSSVRDAPAVSANGADLGQIGEVLFHPTEPRVVGFSVRPPRFAGIIARPERYVPLAMCQRRGEAVACASKRLPTIGASERALGLLWEETVQWRGMTVAAASGSVIGAVADVEFDWATGAVKAVQISSGTLGDVAVGKLFAPAEAIVGFRDGAVRLSCEYSDLSAEGGAAKAAAVGVTMLKETGSAFARRAYDTGMSAAIAVGRSMKHGRGKRIVDALKKAVSDAMHEDE